MEVDPKAHSSAGLSNRVLDPMDRISEVLVGLIMALTFTCTLGVVTADRLEVRTMLVGALGCNQRLHSFKQCRAGPERAVLARLDGLRTADRLVHN